MVDPVGVESIHPESAAAKRTFMALPKVSRIKNLSFQNGSSLSNEAGLSRFFAPIASFSLPWKCQIFSPEPCS